MWSWFCNDLFLIPSSFGASGKLCFVIMAFLGSLLLYVIYFEQSAFFIHLLIAKGFADPKGLLACTYLNDHARLLKGLGPLVQ